MTLAKVIAALGVLAMSVALLNAFVTGDFFTEGTQLLTMPWGIVSLVDLYVGFALFACWIWQREASTVRAVVWIALLLTLGFWAGSLYVLLALFASKGDWAVFWQGVGR